MAAKVPSLFLVGCILVGCVLATIWLVIFGITFYLSFHGPLWVLTLSLSVVVLIIGLIWSTFYRLTFIRDDIRESDPRIYVKMTGPEELQFRHAPFILANYGGGVAHNIQIEPLTIGRRRIEFPQIPVISVGESREVAPRVGGKDLGSIVMDDIFPWMEEDWNTSKGNVTAEWITHLAVSYDDYTGTRHIKSTMMLVFYPLDYKHQREAGQPLSRQPICEFRNIEFGLLDAKDKIKD